MKTRLQNGFAHVGLLLLVLVVLVALIGYKVSKDRSNTVVDNSTGSTVAQQIPVINNTNDLSNIQKTLNNENVDGDLNPSSLNNDVTNLL